MRRILIIDDDATLLAAMEAHLGKQGYLVLKALSGEVGIRLAADQPLCLIVLDLCLPHSDGLHVLTRLRARANTKKTPVLVVTGSTPPKERERLRGLGVSRLIAKPCSPWQLAGEIDRLLLTTEQAADIAAPT